jgi:hypothetical protein
MIRVNLLPQFFLILLSATPGWTQVVFGQGPSLQATPASPEFGTFGIDSTTNCPTPSFSVGGFGGYGNDWANANTRNQEFTPYTTSSTGVGNYGIAAGLRIPFGHGLSEFCKEYAKAKADFEKTRAENNRRNAALVLVTQCDWLRRYSFNLDSSAFDQEEFSSLKPCRKFIAEKARALGGSGGGVGDQPSNPPDAKTERFSPDVPVFIEQRQNRRF